MTAEDLQKRLIEAKKKYYQLREEILTAKEKNHAQLRHARREIARIKTRLQEL